MLNLDSCIVYNLVSYVHRYQLLVHSYPSTSTSPVSALKRLVQSLNQNTVQGLVSCCVIGRVACSSNVMKYHSSSPMTHVYSYYQMNILPICQSQSRVITCYYQTYINRFLRLVIAKQPKTNCLCWTKELFITFSYIKTGAFIVCL